MARCVHFAALMALFGGALFSLRTGVRGRPPLWAAWLVLPSGFVWLAYVVSEIAGGPGEISHVDLVALFVGVDFGRAWLAHLGVTAIAVLLAFQPLRTGGLLIAASGLALATPAGFGHAATGEAGLGMARLATDAVHLLAGGAWLGALMPLQRALRDLSPGEAEGVTSRFSTTAYASVALLVVTGALNIFFATHALLPKIDTTYGRLLLLKLIGVCMLFALAAFNRFALSRPLRPLALRKTIAVEHVIFALVLLCVSELGISAPG